MADWEQLEGEAANHYSWFLAYRNLGPSRTLERAYRATTGSDGQPPGAWTAASSRHRWPERAAAWDVHVLSDAGAQVVVLFVAAMGELARQTLDALRRHPPQSYAEAMRALDALAALVPADAVAAAQDRAAAGQTPEIGGHAPAPVVVQLGQEVQP